MGTDQRVIQAALGAGVASGVAGLVVFLVIHHFWIRPIWFILPPGLLIAALGGLAVGWSYAHINPGLPPRPWTFLGVIAVIGLTLLPAVLLGQMRAPLFDIATGTIPPSQTGRAVIHFVIELVLPAVIIGAAAGWYLGRTPAAAFSTAVAGLVFALGPGHNIPFLGNTPAVGKGLTLLVAVIAVSAVVLVESGAWLAKR